MSIEQWISVKDRLPGENDEILVACSWFGVGLSAWHESGDFFFMDGDRAEEVTHWMIAPKSPCLDEKGSTKRKPEDEEH